MKQQHGHTAIRLESVSSGVGCILWNAGAIDESDRTDHAGEEQIVDDFGPLVIDLRIYLMDESSNSKAIGQLGMFPRE